MRSELRERCLHAKYSLAKSVTSGSMFETAGGQFMNVRESFREKSFVVVDEDARVRNDDDLLSFALDAHGKFLKIPPGTDVKIDRVKVVEVGSRSTIVFGRATSVDGAHVIGWTSTRNLDGKFVNETVGSIRSESSSQYGPNAAWAGGKYLGQIELVSILSASLALERVAIDTVDPFLSMVSAAASANIIVTLNSGFRSYAEQKYLHDGYKRGLPGFNLAAAPGFSHHQNGIAFDISVAGGDGNPTYEWLKRNATNFGFVRTVNKEPWHWEHDPKAAAKAAAVGTFKTSGVAI